jgi:hypothetical protein
MPRSLSRSHQEITHKPHVIYLRVIRLHLIHLHLIHLHLIHLDATPPTHLDRIRVMSAIRANKPGGPTMNRTCSATKVARYAMRQDGGFYART